MEFTLDIMKSNFPEEKVKLYAFSDASFANEEERQSLTGYIIYVNVAPSAWRSKKQSLVTTNTFTSDYVASSHTNTDSLWMKGLFKEIGIQTIEVPKILVYNNGVVLSVSVNVNVNVNVNVKVNGTGGNPSNTKSVDTKENHVQGRVQKGEVKVEYVDIQDNIADALTKPLSYIAFGRHFTCLGFENRFAIPSFAFWQA